MPSTHPGRVATIDTWKRTTQRVHTQGWGASIQDVTVCGKTSSFGCTRSMEGCKDLVECDNSQRGVTQSKYMTFHTSDPWSP
jgi:hypothetical protein